MGFVPIFPRAEFSRSTSGRHSETLLQQVLLRDAQMFSAWLKARPAPPPMDRPLCATISASIVCPLLPATQVFAITVRAPLRTPRFVL